MPASHKKTAAEPSTLEELVAAVAAGQSECVELLLQALADEILILPAVAIENLKDERSTNRIRVVNIKAEGMSFVPVFTSEDYFLDWSDGRYQCLSLAGGDIAVTLAPGTGFLLNPGSHLQLEIGPAEVEALATIDAAEALAPQQIEEEADAPAPGSAAADDFGDSRPVEILDEDEAMIDYTDSSASGWFELGRLRAELVDLINQFPEVEEAYFEEATAGQSCAVLGLLIDRIDPERRFSLIDSVAEVARRYFGAAGAIEVYDDLNRRTSASWNLFHALVPFYSRDRYGEFAQTEHEEREAKPSRRRKHDSALVIEKSHTAGTVPDKSPWHRLRERGSRLLGALQTKLQE